MQVFSGRVLAHHCQISVNDSFLHCFIIEIDD